MDIAVGFGIYVWATFARGFTMHRYTVAEFHRTELVLAVWGVITLAIAVLGMVRGLPEIVTIQVVLGLVTLAVMFPVVTQQYRETRPPAPVAPVVPRPNCVHGNCEGG